MSEPNWNPDKFISYRFVSDFAVITFTVPGLSDWSDEVFDSVAYSDLADYVTEPDAYYVDDCWETNNVSG